MAFAVPAQADEPIVCPPNGVHGEPLAAVQCPAPVLEPHMPVSSPPRGIDDALPQPRPNNDPSLLPLGGALPLPKPRGAHVPLIPIPAP
ncbi:hypothetical protein [Spirillospora sp. CA-294931]|uniref:hypothetical protein n=1 Tax=Spirillospora sp. CA-294931 TaxID=3240042 RepID=UPI003D8A0741